MTAFRHPPPNAFQVHEGKPGFGTNLFSCLRWNHFQFFLAYGQCSLNVQPTLVTITITKNLTCLVRGVASAIKLRINDMASDLKPGSNVTISVRPENILVAPGIDPGDNRLSGKVEFIRDVGSSVEVYLDCDGLQITSQSTPKGRPEVRQGDDATAILPPEACVVLRS